MATLSQQAVKVAKLRTFIVVSVISMAAASVVCAFLLAWNSLAGSPWFLATAFALSVQASITATCHRVSAKDFLGMMGVISFKDAIEKKNVA